MITISRNFWKPVPFLRIGIPWTIGIILGHWLPPRSSQYSFLFPALALILVTELIPLKWSRLLGVYRGILLLVWIAFAGYVRTGILLFSNNLPVGIQNSASQKALVISEPLQRSGKGWKTIANKLFMERNGQFTRMPGKILVYLDSTAPSLSIGTGTVLLTYTPLQKIPKAANPGAWDPAEYYGKKQIFYQCYLPTQGTRKALHQRSAYLPVFLQRVQQHCLQTLNRFIDGKEEQAIAAALLIGYKLDLPAELTSAYRDTGIIHVIAISGMHMALLFGLLQLLLTPLSKRKAFRHLVPVLLLVTAWLFCLLTGATPSILRAAFICSIWVISQWWKKENHTLNSLAASAVCLLIVDPILLTDVGFQLSYAAVIGILIFSGPLSKNFHFSNPLLRTISQLIAVTLAAQLLTFPLLLYHFHRFPLLFIFTNLIAVPLSTCLLYFEIALLMLSQFQMPATLIGKIIQWGIYTMNQWALQTSQLPGTLITGIYLSLPQTLLLLTAILFFASGVIFGIKKYGWTGLICLLAVMLLGSLRQYRVIQQHKLIVYHVRNQSAIHLLEGQRQCLLTFGREKNPIWAEKFISTAEWYWGARRKETLQHTFLHYPILSSQKKLVVLIDGSRNLADLPLPQKADLIILMRNPPFTLHWLSNRLQCSQFVADGSNRMWKIREWKKEAARLHLHCHSTPEQGAFIINF